MTPIEIKDHLNRLHNYILSMAPHQKERAGGQLLIKSHEAIKQLFEVVEDYDAGINSLAPADKMNVIDHIQFASKRVQVTVKG